MELAQNLLDFTVLLLLSTTLVVLDASLIRYRDGDQA